MQLFQTILVAVVAIALEWLSLCNRRQRASPELGVCKWVWSVAPHYITGSLQLFGSERI